MCGGGNNLNISILVNNAGIGGAGFGDATPEAFDRVINTNLKGAYFLSRLIADEMIANKIEGNILNIASSSSLRPAITAYNLSKWSIRGLTLGLAKALIPHGIVVNAIAPGPTATPMLSHVQRSKDNLYLPQLPLGRFATVEEISDMAVISCSEIGRTMVGNITYMTGGAGTITYDDVYYDYNPK